MLNVVSEIFDRIPRADGSFRRRLTSGILFLLIVIIGVVITNGILGSGLSGNSPQDIWKALAGPSVLVFIFAIVLTIGALIEILANQARVQQSKPLLDYLHNFIWHGCHCNFWKFTWYNKQSGGSYTCTSVVSLRSISDLATISSLLFAVVMLSLRKPERHPRWRHNSLPQPRGDDGQETHQIQTGI